MVQDQCLSRPPSEDLARRRVTVKKLLHFRPRVGFVVYENVIDTFVIPVLDENFNGVLPSAILKKGGFKRIIMVFVFLEIILVVVLNCFVDLRVWARPGIPTLQ